MDLDSTRLEGDFDEVLLVEMSSERGFGFPIPGPVPEVAPRPEFDRFGVSPSNFDNGTRSPKGSKLSQAAATATVLGLAIGICAKGSFSVAKGSVEDSDALGVKTGDLAERVLVVLGGDLIPFPLSCF